MVLGGFRSFHVLVTTPLLDNPAALSVHYWYWLKTCIWAINVWDFKIDGIHLGHVATVLRVIASKWQGILLLSPVLMWHHACGDLIPHCTPESRCSQSNVIERQLFDWLRLGLEIKHKRNPQRAKKVVSDSLGLVDFAIGLVIFVLNLPDRQVLFWGEIQITEGL